MSDIEKLKFEFEVWAKSNGIQLTLDVNHEGYHYPLAKASWAAWQESARRSDGAAGTVEKDAARLDFIEYCVMTNGKTFSAKRDYDGFTSSPTFGYIDTVQVFTVPSQHVRGIGLRGAIDAAIEAHNKAGKEQG